MKKLKIAHQLFALVGVLMAAFAVATYFEIRTSEQAIYDERFDMLRTQVESGISVLNTFYEREKAGQMIGEARLGSGQAVAAILVATALAEAGPVLIATSDPGDLKALVGDEKRVTVVAADRV